MLLIYILSLLTAQLVNSYPRNPNPSSHEVHVSPPQSIQSAIDGASPGTTITVSAGTYAEQLTITTDHLTLIGDGAILTPPHSPTSNICTGLAGNDTSAGICVTGTGVALAEFVAEHRRFISVAKRTTGVSISGFTVDGFYGTNIGIVGAEGTSVSFNNLLNGAVYGFVAVGSIDTSVHKNAVYNNQGTLGGIATCTDDISGAKVSKNSIAGYAVGLCCQTSGGVYTANDVNQCCVGAFVDPGVVGAKVLDNYIGPTNPLCAGNVPVNGGIFVYGSVDAVVSGNTIKGQHAGGMAGGLVLVDALEISPDFVATGNHLTGNVLVDNDYDVFVNSTGTGNVVAGNQCSTCT